MFVESVRKSCIRTLSAKYRMYEKLTEKRFELDDHGIPMVEDFEATIKPLESSYSFASTDEALMYGISNSGLFVLTLSRVRVPTRQFNCFVMGCQSASPSMYLLHVKEKQRFPGWRTGFSSSIHGSLDGRRIGLCTQHVKDLYLGHISLQSVDFGSLVRWLEDDTCHFPIDEGFLLTHRIACSVLVNPYMVVANHSTHFVRDNLSGMFVDFKLKMSLHFGKRLLFGEWFRLTKFNFTRQFSNVIKCAWH